MFASEILEGGFGGAYIGKFIIDKHPLNTMLFLDKQKITFNDLIKFLEHIIAEQGAKAEVQCVYHVFDQEQKGHVPVNELNEALERMYGKKLPSDELQGILSLADRDMDGCADEEGKCMMEHFLPSFF